jgi:hypothetical protein
MELDKDFFNQFEYKEIEFKGEKGEVPAKYFDVFSFSAVFPVSARKLKRYLPSKKMKLIKPFPGISLIFVIAYEYKHISVLEPYNEVGIGIPLIFQEGNQKYEGSKFIHLPVTTERARELGCDLYGYPKFVADINFEKGERTTKCTLNHDNKHVLSLEIPKLEVEETFSETHSFTVKDKKLLRTRVTSQGFSGTDREKGKAILSFGDHPIAKEIDDLLYRNESVAHSYEPKKQAILPLAEEEYDL